ncbi:hypothetical protein KIN20_007245 [Parelaphostrongylus tenuis]|uniref:Actin maturation protease n=1 Tax=Parelaphostrongylus tenuis TaxID=148309 RepID=A0AAD5QJV9_PARTN|nr:hypothetical protein KIN20_007245 [Parelaphostrongylus tenuis]
MAKKLGLTASGEMFSSQWLCQLASSLWPLYSEVTSFPSPTTLVEWMESGCAMLIPYDCDKNHEPTLRNGHGAHWCLLVGFLYVDDTLTDLRPASAVMTVDDENAFYVFAYHGKSKHMGLWSYSDLRQSSLQLFEVGAQRSSAEYILPSDGLSQLRGKCVILMRNKLNL